MAQQAIRVAKNAWFQYKALEAEIGRHGGKICSVEMYPGYQARLVPVKSAGVKGEDGNVEAQGEIWRHFAMILNFRVNMMRKWKEKTKTSKTRIG